MHAEPLIRPFSTTIRAAIEDFILTRQIEGRSAKTLRFYRQALGKFAAFAGTLPPSGITVQVMRRYLAHLGDLGLATQSQHNYAVAVKTFLRWMADEGDYDLDVAWLARIKPVRVVADKTVPFTDAEVQRLFAAVSIGWYGMRQRAMLAVLLDTGVRISELCGLRLADVDLHTGALYLRAETVKTRVGRTTWLGLRAKKIVNGWWQAKRHMMDLDPESYFFVGRDDGQLTPRYAHMSLALIGKRAGIADVHPHRFRHTFTRNCIRAGMDLFEVQALLGHTDLTMTRRYFAQEQQDVSATKRAKSPLDRIKLR